MFTRGSLPQAQSMVSTILEVWWLRHFLPHAARRLTGMKVRVTYWRGWLECAPTYVFKSHENGVPLHPGPKPCVNRLHCQLSHPTLIPTSSLLATWACFYYADSYHLPGIFYGTKFNLLWVRHPRPSRPGLFKRLQAFFFQCVTLWQQVMFISPFSSPRPSSSLYSLPCGSRHAGP